MTTSACTQYRRRLSIELSTWLTRTRHVRSLPVTETSSTSPGSGRGPTQVLERKNATAFLAASKTVVAVVLWS
jgi:hypothetical protein